MKMSDYAEKMKEESSKFPWMPLSKKQLLSEKELIILRQNYFFKNEKDRSCVRS